VAFIYQWSVKDVPSRVSPEAKAILDAAKANRPNILAVYVPYLEDKPNNPVSGAAIIAATDPADTAYNDTCFISTSAGFSRNTLIHEVCHILGCDHVDNGVTWNIMWYKANTNGNSVSYPKRLTQGQENIIRQKQKYVK